jgi:hypothetical protein
MVWVAATLIPLVGCLDDRCGPNARYVDGECIPISGGDDDAAPRDATEDSGQAPDTKRTASDTMVDGEPDATPAPDSGISGLGDPCKTDAECKGAADYCAIQPPQTSGYCTITGCDAKKPDSCPQGYYCLDLSIFNPQLPKVCAKK